MTPEQALVHAVTVALQSPCAKSKRGVVIFDASGALGFGFNGPPLPFRCDGSDACRAACGKVAVHAEDRAIRSAISLHFRHPAISPCDLLHVKVKDGHAVPSGPPNCWQCSRTILDAEIAGVWLLHEEGLRRYSAAEFHRLTLETCGLPVVLP